MVNIQVPTIKLNNGAEMPQVGLGLWKVDKDACADVVYNAIKEGYRLFDGACGMCLSHSSFSNRSAPSLDSLLLPRTPNTSPSTLTAALVLHNIPRSANPFLSTLIFLLSWLL